MRAAAFFPRSRSLPRTGEGGFRARGRVVLAMFLLLGCAGAMVVPAGAQLAVDLKMEKRTYISYEPVKATVVIYNRTGRDVVLGGPGNTSWLQFQVSNYSGNLLTPVRGGVKMDPILLPAHGPVTKTVDVSEFYPVYEFGTYRIRASVFYPPNRQFFDSQRKNISVADGKTIWGPIQVPRPSTFHGQGGNRTFSLLKYRGQEKTELYVRVKDSRTGGVYATYSLGDVILFYEPQATIDEKGKLHVLYVAAPQMFAHSVVDYSGQWESRKLYKPTPAGRPTLTLSSYGNVRVRGGVEYDPEKAMERPEGIHSLSERPPIPGLK